MARSLQRLKQIDKPSDYDDQKDASEIQNSEVNSSDFSEFQSALLSQIKRIIHGSDPGNWFDDPETVFGASSTLKNLFFVCFKEVACLATDTVGKCMCIRDEPSNGKWRVQTANPYETSKMPALGVLISKSTPTVGIIQVFGSCSIFSGLDVSRPAYYVGLSGDPVPTCPSASGSPTGKLYAQVFGKATSDSTLYLNSNLNMIALRG